MVGKHGESTNPVREGFLEYAAGAVAKREFWAKGNYTLEEGRKGGSPGCLEWSGVREESIVQACECELYPGVPQGAMNGPKEFQV